MSEYFQIERKFPIERQAGNGILLIVSFPFVLRLILSPLVRPFSVRVCLCVFVCVCVSIYVFVPLDQFDFQNASNCLSVAAPLAHNGSLRSGPFEAGRGASER